MDRRRHFLAVAAFVCLAVLPSAQAQQSVKKLKVAIGSTSFAWLPMYVADGAGFFKSEGLDVEIINTAANAAPFNAILSGNADIAGSGLQAAFAAADKKLPVRLLTPMNTEYTPIIFVNKSALRKMGVTKSSPLKDRVKAMAGLKLATTAVGAGVDLMYRYLFAKYGDGLSAERDASILPLGDARNVLAALKNGSVDVAQFSPPAPLKAVADGYAEILINTIDGDVPELRGMVFTALAVTNDKIRTDSAALEAFVRAIDRANKLIYSDPQAAGNAARKFVGVMEPELYSASVRALVNATPKAPTMPIEGLKIAMSVFNTVGLKYTVDYDAIVANDLVQRALAASSK